MNSSLDNFFTIRKYTHHIREQILFFIALGFKVREYLRKLELQVIWSGPYSYSTAPIEMVFGALKFGELNPNKKPTGKKVSHTIILSNSVVSS